MAASAHAAASTSPYIALGLLSGTKNQDRRTIIRQVSNNLDSYFYGRSALRCVPSVPPLSPIRAELLDAERDLVLLDGRETREGFGRVIRSVYPESDDEDDDGGS